MKKLITAKERRRKQRTTKKLILYILFRALAVKY
jgi:hypothetical protein